MVRRIDEYTLHLILLIIFAGTLIVLEQVFTESIQGFISALLPTLLLILLYILLHRRFATFEQSIYRILQTHIPDIVYIENPGVLREEFVKAARDAQNHVMITGSTSSINEHLSTLEERVLAGEIEYYRILLGEPISQELGKHLLRILGLNGVYATFIARESTPTLLLTEKVAFIALPHPYLTEFEATLKIPDRRIIEQLERYIRSWYARGRRLNDSSDLKGIRVSRSG